MLGSRVLNVSFRLLVSCGQSILKTMISEVANNLGIAEREPFHLFDEGGESSGLLLLATQLRLEFLDNVPE